MRDEPPEVNPLLADARDALERKEYATALTGLDRLLASTPSDREGQDLRKVALYQYGKSQFDQKQFEESYRTLTQLAKIQPGYEDSPRLLQQARARPSTSTTARASSSTATRSSRKPSASGRSCSSSIPPTSTPRRISTRPSGC